MQAPARYRVPLSAGSWSATLAVVTYLAVVTIRVTVTVQRIVTEAILTYLPVGTLGILATGDAAEPVDALLTLRAVGVEAALGRNLAYVPADSAVAELALIAILVGIAKEAAKRVDADLACRAIRIVQTLRIGLRPVDTDEVDADLGRRAIGISRAKDGTQTVDANLRLVTIRARLAGIVRSRHALVILADHSLGAIRVHGTKLHALAVETNL